LPVDFLPNITYPLIKVHIWWRGATPQEIEEHIAEIIERDMGSVEGLDYLESSSLEGTYTLQVNFRYGYDVNVAFQDVQAAMARAARKLPPEMDPPVILKADPQQLPIVQLTIHSSDWNLVQIRDWAEYWLLPRIMAVPGVSGGEIAGGLKREIRVHLDPVLMEKYNISVAEIQRILAAANVEKFAGRIIAGRQELIARTTGEFRSLDQIRDVVLRTNAHSKLYLRDIAKVLDSHEEVRIITRLGRQPCVKISVQKQPDANTVAVTKDLEQRLAQLRSVIPQHLELGTVESQAQYIERALDGVKDAALQATLLVLLVSFLFLGSLRQALMLLIALPLIFVSNFIFMQWGGFTINIFTLAGLVIALGLMLDNSIVVLENITRLKHSQDAPLQEVAISATAQITSAIIAASLTLLALLVPFLMVAGLTSLLFRELILVIAGIVLISMVCSLIFIPMLSTLLLKQNTQHNTKTPLFERITERVSYIYAVVLRGLLRVRWLIALLFLAMTIGASLLIPSLGTEFLPEIDDGRIMVKVKLPTGSSLYETDKILQRVEQAIAGDPLIESAFTLVGAKTWGLYSFEIANEGEVNIQLVPHRERDISTFAYMRRLNKRLADLAPPGGGLMVRKMRIKGIRKMGESDLEIQIRGPDIDRLFQMAKQVTNIAQNIPTLTNVHLGMDLSKPEFQIHIDRIKAAELGISIDDVATSLRSLIHGVVATRYKRGLHFYDIRLRIPEEKLRSKLDIQNLLVTNKKGQTYRIRDIAKILNATGVVEIVREDQVKQVIVRADALGTSVGQALQALNAKLQKINMPVGYEIRFAGKARLMKDLIDSTLQILALAIFLALIVLAVQFNNVRYPVAILGCIPISASGMVFALWYSELAMGATVLIGLLIVIAATINDGVLLFTFADELKAQNPSLSVFEAIIEAARIRLRPRIMTTVTTIAGLFPLALQLGEGGELLQPLAIAAIGGLLIEIPVALFFMPCLYSLFRTR
jgi:hydrophobe/amphiphile efflux-1 (HAE1) family protein